MPEIGWAGIGTMSWLELIWLVCGIGGALNYWFLVLGVTGDRRFVYAQEIKNPLREITVEMSWWTELTHFIILMGFATIGFVASIQAPVNANRIYTPVSVTITVVLFGITIALNALGAARRRWRNRLYVIEESMETAERRAAQWDGADRRHP
jgi:protein-S-isoprenylcysteine O-methyltransferase Ste14